MIHKGLLAFVDFLGFGVSFLIAIFFVMTVSAGHAFPFLGFATVFIGGCVWGLLGGVVFGARETCKTAVIGSGSGVFIAAVLRAFDRAETLGYVAGFFSEWRGSFEAMFYVAMIVFVFSSLSAGVKFLFTSRKKDSDS